MQLNVDATDAPRHLLHAQLAIPVKPGPLTLLYPTWIPGHHRPDGPIVDLVGLRIAGEGKPLLAGVGDGNTTDEALAALEDAAKKGIVVVRSSRVGSGVTRRNVGIDDDRRGFVVSGELNPQKARVLLMLGLTRTSNVRTLQGYFWAY